uniref:Secreted protein n=1 Tax=Ananas comosus var. bracteatus TaxID=296719 RepID=A0A6V7NHH1_ANACO|nr:unnamed protein product [Ananas comosus var. bracteatus]
MALLTLGQGLFPLLLPLLLLLRSSSPRSRLSFSFSRSHTLFAAPLSVSLRAAPRHRTFLNFHRYLLCSLSAASFTAAEVIRRPPRESDSGIPSETRDPATRTREEAPSRSDASFGPRKDRFR